MNNEFSRLRHTEKQESISENQQEQNTQSNAKEFSTVEELLREDAAQTVVPPEIAVRLKESIAKLPKPTTSWWRKFFFRK
jgi:hypothetical protein